MTAFVVAAVLIVVATLGVLLWPLLRGQPQAAAVTHDDTAQSNLRILRAQLSELDDELAAGSIDATQHASARAEIERRVLEETAAAAPPPRATAGRKSAIALALVLPLSAAVLYAQLGSRDAMNPELVAGTAPTEPPTAAEMAAAADQLAARLKAEPENAEGWALLGRTYIELERVADARDAFAQAVQRRGDDPDLLADYADALARSNNRILAGEPEKLLARALAINPDHGKALALSGAAAMARGDADTALAHWTKLRARLAPDTPMVQGLDMAIDRARAAKGLPPLSAQTAQPAPPATAAAPTAPLAAAPKGAALRVTVKLAPELAAKVQPGDTLFVFARAAEGPRMPLAVSRQPLAAAPQQPIVVQLDDSQAMTPQSKLSSASRVVVAARISRAGSATPSAGDLEAESAPMAPSGDVALVIDRVRP
jgi:cytochrome c-type biogenesis protein CcmH